MRVYEPKRGGDIAERDGSTILGAVVYHKDRVIGEFDYAAQAHDYARRCHDLGIQHLKIVNPATR